MKFVNFASELYVGRKYCMYSILEKIVLRIANVAKHVCALQIVFMCICRYHQLNLLNRLFTLFERTSQVNAPFIEYCVSL